MGRGSHTYLPHASFIFLLSLWVINLLFLWRKLSLWKRATPLICLLVWVPPKLFFWGYNAWKRKVVSVTYLLVPLTVVGEGLCIPFLRLLCILYAKQSSFSITRSILGRACRTRPMHLGIVALGSEEANVSCHTMVTSPKAAGYSVYNVPEVSFVALCKLASLGSCCLHPIVW